MPFKPFPYFTRQQLEESSPSREDGISWELESKLRKTVVKLLKDAGHQLKLPQWAVATAIVFCHRFYALASFKRNDRIVIATACLSLAAKCEESPRRLSDLLPICWLVRSKNDAEQARKSRDKEFMDTFKEQVLAGERVVLFTLGFQFNVRHPLNYLLRFLKETKLMTNDKSLAQAALNFVNDSQSTTLCLQYNEEIIAKSAVHLAATLLKVDIPVPDGTTFYDFFKVPQEAVEDISAQIKDLYDVIPVAETKPDEGPEETDGDKDVAEASGADWGAQASEEALAKRSGVDDHHTFSDGNMGDSHASPPKTPSQVVQPSEYASNSDPQNAHTNEEHMNSQKSALEATLAQVHRIEQDVPREAGAVSLNPPNPSGDGTLTGSPLRKRKGSSLHIEETTHKETIILDLEEDGGQLKPCKRVAVMQARGAADGNGLVEVDTTVALIRAEEQGKDMDLDFQGKEKEVDTHVARSVTLKSEGSGGLVHRSPLESWNAICAS